MADPKTRQNAGRDPEKLPERPEHPSETREDVQVEGQRERADLAIELLEGRTGKSARELIDSLDLSKAPESQEENLEALKGTALTMLIKLYGAGHPVEDEDDLLKMAHVQFPENVSLDEARGEVSAFRKLAEIIDKKDLPVSRSFLRGGQFERLLTVAQKAVRGGKALQEHVEGTIFDAATGKRKPKEGVLDKSVAWVKEFASAHPYATAGLALAAAYGGYKLISALFSDTEEEGDKGGEKKDRKWSKNGIAIAALSACALGIFLGRDKLQKWLGVSLTADAMKDFMSRIFGGDFSGAFDALKEGAKVSALHKKVAEKIGGNAAAISMLSAVSYENFASEVSGYLSKGKSYLFESFLPKLKVPLVFDSEKATEAVKAEQKLIELFRANKGVLDEARPRTVEDALAVLEQKGVLGGAPIALPVESKETDEEKEPETAGVNEEGEKELLESFTDKNAPHVAKVLRKYEGAKKLWNPIDFVTKLKEAAEKDKTTILVGAGKALIWDGYKWVTITSLSALADTFVKILQLPSEDVGIGDVVTTYFYNGAWFIALGAAWGAIKGGPSGWIGGAISGAKAGAIMPITVARAHIGAARFVYEGAHGLKYSIQHVISPAEYAPNLWRQEAEFFAKQFSRYRSMHMAVTQGSWRKLDDAARKLLARFAFSKEKLAQRTEAAARSFAKAYNNAKGLRPGKPGYLKIVGDEMDWMGKVDEALEDVKKLPGGPNAAVPASFTEAEITAKAAEIKAQRVGSAKGLADFANGKVDDMLRQHGIKPGTSEAGEFMEKWDSEMAQRALRGEKIGDGMPEFAKMQRIEFVKDLPNGNKVYRYRGMEVELSPFEAADQPPEVQKRCHEKWQGKAVELLSVTEVREYGKGLYEYKMNGKWIKMEAGELKIDQIKAKFLELHGNQPGALEVAEKGGLMKYLPKLPVLINVLGLAASLKLIYDLETATDKKKAVAVAAVGFAAFLAGARMTEAKIGSRLKNPYLKVAVDFLGGLAVAIGVSEPLGKLVDEYLLQFPGAHGVSQEAIDMFEQLTVRHGVRVGIRSATWAAEKKLFGRIGLRSIETLFAKKIEAQFMKKIAKVAAKQGVKQVLKMLGWKGATTAVLLADDATVIGVLDDIIAVGLMAWMAVDIYDIVQLVRNAMKMEEEMKKRTGKPVAAIKILNKDGRASLQKRFENLTLEPGTTIEDALAGLEEEKLFDVLRGEPNIVLQIEREGIAGREEWTLVNGDAVGMTVKDASGGVIAEVTNDDAEAIEKALESEAENEEKPA